MSEVMLGQPIELSDAELDLVAGGLAVAGGLVNVPINISQNDVDILNKANILNVTVGDVTLKDIANNNHIMRFLSMARRYESTKKGRNSIEETPA